MEVSEVRRRLRTAIDQARRDSSLRRERADAASRAYDQFLEQVAVPTFQTIANVLIAEGHRFAVFTPAGSVRLASERSGEDFIELALDASQDPPVVVVRMSRGRGRRQLTSERSVTTPISSLTDSDVVQMVVDEIPKLVER
jgi:hypothetical protein